MVMMEKCYEKWQKEEKKNDLWLRECERG